MKTIENILIASDSTDGLAAAAEKALMIGNQHKINIRVLEVLWNSLEEEKELAEVDKKTLIDQLIFEERKLLSLQLEPLSASLPVDAAQVTWGKQPEKSIAVELDHHNTDLLIKPTEKHGLLKHLFTPLDRRLIRDSSCSVLVSKSARWERGGNVLAAFDTTGEHATINRHIIQMAAFLCNVLQADLHLMTSAPIPRHLVSADLLSSMIAIREKTLQAIALLCGNETATIHVELGTPAQTIDQNSEQLAASVTVLGTNARSGVKNLMLGSTAERVLGRISGDVVAVRAGPRGRTRPH